MKEKEARKDLPRWLKKLPWTKWQSDAQGNPQPCGARGSRLVTEPRLLY